MTWWRRAPARESSASEPIVGEAGFLFGRLSLASGGAQAAYLAQLLDEQFATAQEGDILLPWDQLYRLMGDEAHASSVRLLGLPPITTLVPQLDTSGTPSEATFKVVIKDWFSANTGIRETNVERQGGCLRVRGQPELVPFALHALIQEMQALARYGEGWTGEERLLCTGRIRRLAIAGGARLDDYLAKTNIVAADRLDLQLHRSDALGVPVVEIRPVPKDAPEQWLDAYDRYDTARPRYDLAQPQRGLAHVVATPEVTEVLQAIKRIPGRRVASDEARLFVHNPYAVLGDAADQVIDAQAFEASRHASGLGGKTLRVAAVAPGQRAITGALIDTGALSEDIEIEIGGADAFGLCEAHQRSVSRGVPLFTWRGHEIDVAGETALSVANLKQWISGSDLSRFTINRAEVLDLSAYSDRVVGFDGAMISVPYVARKEGTKGWIPENLERGVIRKETASGASEQLQFTQEQLRELGANVDRALEARALEVRVPGTDRSVPTKEAAAWVTAFESEAIPLGRAARDPQPERDPATVGPTPILKILHNIEKLEYDKSGSSGGSLIAAVPADAQPQLPAALRSQIALLPHQQSGLAWLQHRFVEGVRGVTGCLLADDMGLGKTLQALCLISWYLETHEDARSCLIVAPVSLLENWKAEINNFLDGRHAPILALYGTELKAHRALAGDIDPELHALGLRKFLRSGFERDYRIVLTTYETLRDYEFSLARVQWGVVVCDEAQKIKTPGALVTRAAKALRAHFKVACTGTPVENTLADLWCLFDFFQPGLLGSLNEFTNEFRRTIETRASGHDELTETLRGMLTPWILRRMKSEVAQLPQRIDHHHQAADFEWRLPMSQLQRRLYFAAVEQYRELAEKQGQGTAILQVLHTLRMICSNPLACAYEDSEFRPIEDHVRDSPKLAWTLERLAAIKTWAEKAIVFTEYRELQRLIQRAIMHRFGIRAQIINGGTSVDPLSEVSRQRLIDQFQAAAGFGVIILSTTAVGFGVNVQGANHVIHFTRPWNPAKEDQATDRAYRIGQKRDVFVYCPTIVGANFDSFDQRVETLLTEKRALSRDILAGTHEITLDEFKGL